MSPLFLRLLHPVAAILILAACLGLIISIVILPVKTRYETNQGRIKENVNRLSKLQSILRSTKIVPGGLDRHNLELYRPDYLVGKRDSGIVAKLQSQIRGIVVSNGSRFISARKLPKKMIGSMTYLGLNLQFSGPTVNVHKILHLIEQSSPILMINKLSLRLAQHTSRRGQSSYILIADLNIYGAKWPSEIVSSPEKSQP